MNLQHNLQWAGKRHRRQGPPAVALTLAVLLLFILPMTVQAADIRTEPGGLTIGPGITVNDDVYAVGQTINLQGTVNGNVFAAGTNTNISGTVNGDLFTGGSTTNITGRIQGNVYTAGGTVVVGGTIGKDLFAWGGTVQLEPGAAVSRDAFASGGNVTVAGSVGRNLQVNGDEVAVAGSVGGNVNGTMSRLRVNPGASIKGNLTYTSAYAADVAPGSVAGTVNAATRPPAQGPSIFAAGLGWLRTVVGLFALGLLLLLLVPRFTKRASDSIGMSPWVSLGSGVALLVAVPFVAILAVIIGAFIGGWWLALALLALYGIALPVGYVLASLFVAGFMAERWARLRMHVVWILLAGLVLLTLAARIPYVGPWITFAAILFGLGAFGATLAGQFQKPPAVAPQEPLRQVPMAA